MSSAICQKLNQSNETTWLQLGVLAEKQGDLDKALYSYTKALNFNPANVKTLSQLAAVSRKRDQFAKAIEYLRLVLGVDNKNGEAWGALGHCYLMTDELRKAYDSFQEALLHLPNPRDPDLWYGIGLLYDRFGCLEQAEGAFTGVLKMDPNFGKKDDVYFHLAVIFKQQTKLEPALDCFKYVLNRPPHPLTESDVLFQIGHTYELMRQLEAARRAYEDVLKANPNNTKVLHRLGWLCHQCGSPEDQEAGHNYLVQSIQLDQSDGHAWYLLGRIYMSQQKFRRSYDAFQQAIYRDPNNPLFWCCIGALYFLMNQHRDALHAYIRSIRLNPSLAEGWFNLGTLYETCDQPQDAMDAYKKAGELSSAFDIAERVSSVRFMLQGGTSNAKSSDIQPVLPDPANPHANRQHPPNSIPDLVLPASSSVGDNAPVASSGMPSGLHTSRGYPA